MYVVSHVHMFTCSHGQMDRWTGGGRRAAGRILPHLAWCTHSLLPLPARTDGVYSRETDSTKDHTLLLALISNFIPVYASMIYSKTMLSFATACLSLTGLSTAQDPADGWMAYAVGQIPDGVDRITRLEMTWKVGEDPSGSNAFFSPWFGMDPADNLNLIQPVNPWLGNGWNYYTEYFQWEPEDNSNSQQMGIDAGQYLKGSLVYNDDDDSYDLTQTNMNTGESSKQNVKCQNGKKFTIPYVVYEKTWPCRDYPPDGVTTFTNIVAECDGKPCTEQIQWSAKVKDANCGMQAHIDNATQIRITWDTNGVSEYDNMTRAELFEMNQKSGVGWSKKLKLSK